ncbi:peptidase C1A papain [Ethanoligenens harbinense YUAN-3]|uniref:Peptidase C1A papain n=2 Tax=Ethanoligenens harbinense TaxID=253239 RepID=E6U581_ETHHY|nr:peptidase C1A papain [Ethanoligenens harbinense YUAN-3]
MPLFPNRFDRNRLKRAAEQTAHIHLLIDYDISFVKKGAAMKIKTTRVCAAVCAFFFLLSSSVPASAATSTAQQYTVQTTTGASISGLSVTSLMHTASSGSGTRKLGYRSTLLQIPHAATGASRRYGAVSIPSSYDLRTTNKLTPIRDQGMEGDCWAYAAIASLESFLMPGEEDDFSESDLVQNAGFDASENDGGNDLMATAYLARWNGPLNEGTTSGVQKHVQNVDWLPSRSGYGDTDTDTAIKQAVMNDGAVSTPIYMDENSYYCASTSSYFDPHDDTANHAVDIVGWNDAYPASNFTTTAGGTPAGNGAFLCRNSWGTSWGDSGYFYVSYYDKSLGQSESAVFDSAESTDNYNRNYQYDPLGLVGEIGMSGSGTQWMANVFTASDNDSLAAMGFYTLIPSTSYNLYIIPNYTGSLTNATLVASGTVADAGYHTAALSNQVALTSGKQFAVEVEFVGQGGVIPIEGPVSGYSSQATASSGQSFVSDNGTDWEDTTAIDLAAAQDPSSGSAQFIQSGSNSNLNVCLKAFTIPLTLSGSTLNANATYYGGIPVGGTAAAHAGLKQVTVSADGKALQTLPETGISADFSYTIPAGTLSSGTHSITVTATDTGNSTVQQTTSIVVGAPQTTIDTLAVDSSGDGGWTVAGWSVAPSGIASNVIYIDKGTANEKQYSAAFTSRPDVQKNIYPNGNYPNGANSGFSVSIPADNLTVGTHTVTVAANAQNGSTQLTTRSMDVGPASLTTIDTPANGSALAGVITVSGWALNHAGINRVDAYLYNSSGTPTPIGSVPAEDMTDRTDVAGAYAQAGYLGLNAAGYTIQYDTSALPAGNYTLVVAGIGNDGSVQWASRGITLGTLPAQTRIDTPANNTYVTGNHFTVSGWALNSSGIQRVDIYAYDPSNKPHQLGSVSSDALSARIDVADAFPAYGTCNSGYSLSASTTGLPAGIYTLAVAGIGKDGSVQWTSRSLTIGPAPQTCIDAPGNGDYVTGQNVTISGWALNHSGIQRVDVYAYDQSHTPHKLGSILSDNMTNRSDVAGAFPAYGMLNSGYSLSVSTADLPAGTYNLAVAGIGNDGDVQWASRLITIGPAPQTHIDAPTSGARVSGQSFTVSGWALNHSGIQRVDVYVYDHSNTPHKLGSVLSDDMTNRSDVAGAFPAYGMLNSGYSLTVSMASLPTGTYNLAVAGIGNDGDVQWASTSISVN